MKRRYHGRKLFAYVAFTVVFMELKKLSKVILSFFDVT